MVVIQLDPLKAPAEAAKDLYRVARKQDRTGSAIFPIIQACTYPVMPMPCLRMQCQILSHAAKEIRIKCMDDVNRSRS